MRPKAYGLMAVALAATAVAYWHCVGLGFVSWDDGMNFSNDRFINYYTWRHAVAFWAHPYAGVYMPVSYTAFGLLSLVARRPDGALDPRVFHAFSVVVHLANAALVYLLLLRFVRREGAALAGALVFGLHPLQVESVAWASDMVRLLAAFFALLALIFYVRFSGDDTAQAPPRGRWAWLAAAFVCGILSVLSKPGVITLPLMAFAIDVFLLGRPWKRPAVIAVAWSLASLPFVAVALIAEPPDHVAPLWSRPVIMLDSLAFYLGKLAWPYPLCVDYGRSPYLTLHSWWRFCTWLAPVVAAALIWRERRRRPWLSGAGLFALFAALPVSGLVPFIYQDYSTVTDRYAYMAVFGLSIAAAFAAARLSRKLLGALSAAAAIVYGALTVALLPTWNDSVSLYRHALAVSPGDFNSHYMLGLALVGAGDLSGAAVEARRAAALNPRAPENATLQAELFYLQGRYTQAASCYRAAIRMNKRAPNAYHSLGMLLIQQGRADEGLELFRDAVQMDPSDPLEHNNFGTALAKCGRWDQALAELLLAERLDPDYRGTRINLCVLYGQLGRVDGVASESRALIALDRGEELGHVNLGQALLAQRRGMAAAAEFREALRLTPGDAAAKEGLAQSEEEGG